MWNAARPKIVDGVKMPNLDLLQNAQNIFNALQADYIPVFIQHRYTKPNGNDANNVNANTDSNVKIALVDTIFAQFNQPFACDLTKPQTATTESNVGTTASNVGTTANPAQSARNQALLENHTYLFNALEEKIQQGHLPPFQREANDMDKPGPNGEIEKIEGIPEGSMPEGAPEGTAPVNVISEDYMEMDECYINLRTYNQVQITILSIMRNKHYTVLQIYVQT
jgi:hypothetical protein